MSERVYLTLDGRPPPHGWGWIACSADDMDAIPIRGADGGVAFARVVQVGTTYSRAVAARSEARAKKLAARRRKGLGR